MSLSARSEYQTGKLICVICVGVKQKTAIAAGSWCLKWNKKRRAALTFTDATLATMERWQRETLKSVKADVRRCPPAKR